MAGWMLYAAALVVVLASVWLYGKAVGRIWTAVGEAVGLIYVAFAIKPLPAGPVSTWLGKVLSPLLPRIFTYYRELFVSSDSGTVTGSLLPVCLLTLVVPVIAAVYSQAELMAVLVVIDVVRHVRKERLLEKGRKYTPSDPENEIAEERRTLFLPDNSVMDNSYHFNRGQANDEI